MGKLAELNDQELLEKFKTCEDEYYVFKTAGDKTMMQKMVWKIIAVKKEMTKRGLDDPALGKTKSLLVDQVPYYSMYLINAASYGISMSLCDVIEKPKTFAIIKQTPIIGRNTNAFYISKKSDVWYESFDAAAAHVNACAQKLLRSKREELEKIRVDNAKVQRLARLVEKARQPSYSQR